MKKLSRNENIGVVVALIVMAIFFFGSPSIQSFLFGGQIEKTPSAGTNLVDTSSDLIIQDIAVGRGKIARPGDKIVVHYVGRFADGVVFDSSTKEGIPFVFILGEGMVIDGWEKGIEGMRVGGHRVLVIPPELAYGKEGRGPIPGNTTLIFEIELIDVLDQ